MKWVYAFLGPERRHMLRIKTRAKNPGGRSAATATTTGAIITTQLLRDASKLLLSLYGFNASTLRAMRSSIAWVRNPSLSSAYGLSCGLVAGRGTSIVRGKPQTIWSTPAKAASASFIASGAQWIRVCVPTSQQATNNN